MPLGMVHGRPRRSLLFHVNTECSAHLALLSSGSIGQPMIEIELASWLNRESAIRFNETLIDQTLTQVKQSLDNTMSDDGYRLFRITFHSNNIKVFKFGQKRPFMSWENDMEPFQVTHFAFTTGCDASGEWIFYEDDSSDLEEVKDKDHKDSPMETNSFYFHQTELISKDEDLQSKDRDGISGADEVKGDIPVNEHEENVPKTNVENELEPNVMDENPGDVLQKSGDIEPRNNSFDWAKIISIFKLIVMFMVFITNLTIICTRFHCKEAPQHIAVKPETVEMYQEICRCQIPTSSSE